MKKSVAARHEKARELAYAVLKQRAKRAGMNPRSVAFKRLIQSKQRQGL